MGRGKIEIKRIDNATNRQVTFCKRRAGLVKKAHELAVLCEANVGLIIFSSSGRLFEYASRSMEAILETYCTWPEASGSHALTGRICSEKATLKEEVEQLQKKLRQMKGEELTHLSLEDLRQLENNIASGIRSVCSRKEELIKAHMEGLIEKEQELQKENDNLKKQILELKRLIEKIMELKLEGFRFQLLNQSGIESEISGPPISYDDAQDSLSSEMLLQLGLNLYHDRNDTSRKTRDECSDDGHDQMGLELRVAP